MTPLDSCWLLWSSLCIIYGKSHFRGLLQPDLLRSVLNALAPSLVNCGFKKAQVKPPFDSTKSHLVCL